MAEPPRIETDHRYRALVVGLALVITASLAYYALALRQADPDTFWHIATGRYIVANGSVPSTDVFSWYGIEHQLAWMPQSWLFGVLVYGAWSLGGFSLVYAATAVAAAAIAGFVYWLFALRSGNRMLALAVAFITMLGIMPSIAPRPQMLTYVLLLGLALLLEHRKWWWAVPVVLLGVNMHGPLFPIYLLVVAYYAWPKRWPILAACAAVVIATPNGLALLPYPFLSLTGNPTGIMELNAVAPMQWPIYLIALIGIVALLDRRDMRARDSLGLLALVVLSLAGLRHMVFIFMLALPLAAPFLKLPSQRSTHAGSDAGLPAEGAASATGPARSSRRVAVLDRILVAVLLTGAIVAAFFAVTRQIEPFREYPEQAALYLRSHSITRYFNEWPDGGFLIFLGMQPLMDGRGEPFLPYPGRPPVTIGIDYTAVWDLRTDCRPFLDGNGITHLLIRQSSQLSRVLEQSPDFRVVYRDTVFIVYERVTPAP
jgi:hypothetical protein